MKENKPTEDGAVKPINLEDFPLIPSRPYATAKDWSIKCGICGSVLDKNLPLAELLKKRCSKCKQDYQLLHEESIPWYSVKDTDDIFEKTDTNVAKELYEENQKIVEDGQQPEEYRSHLKNAIYMDMSGGTQYDPHATRLFTVEEIRNSPGYAKAKEASRYISNIYSFSLMTYACITHMNNIFQKSYNVDDFTKIFIDIIGESDWSNVSNDEQRIEILDIFSNQVKNKFHEFKNMYLSLESFFPKLDKFSTDMCLIKDFIEKDKPKVIKDTSFNIKRIFANQKLKQEKNNE